MKPKEIEILIKYRLEQAQAALPVPLLEATLCTLGTNVPSTISKAQL